VQAVVKVVVQQYHNRKLMVLLVVQAVAKQVVQSKLMEQVTLLQQLPLKVIQVDLDPEEVNFHH
tara:strand:+ start:258 stop:449 length:192 start_codon:yes stop_codon:yes gene_type:complete